MLAGRGDERRWEGWVGCLGRPGREAERERWSEVGREERGKEREREGERGREEDVREGGG